MDMKALRSAMAAAGYFTLKAAGEAIGIPLTSFSRKLKKGSFTLPELQDMKKAYNIVDMDAIFFN